MLREEACRTMSSAGRCSTSSDKENHNGQEKASSAAEDSDDSPSNTKPQKRQRMTFRAKVERQLQDTREERREQMAAIRRDNELLFALSERNLKAAEKDRETNNQILNTLLQRRE